MVSAITASTASVSPRRQDTRMLNATAMMIAMMARHCQVRILGLADRCARLPRRWPMPSFPGSPPGAATGVTTGRHVGADPTDPADPTGVVTGEAATLTCGSSEAL